MDVRYRNVLRRTPLAHMITVAFLACADWLGAMRVCKNRMAEEMVDHFAADSAVFSPCVTGLSR